MGSLQTLDVSNVRVCKLDIANTGLCNHSIRPASLSVDQINVCPFGIFCVCGCVWVSHDYVLDTKANRRMYEFFLISLPFTKNGGRLLGIFCKAVFFSKSGCVPKCSSLHSLQVKFSIILGERGCE